MPTNQTAIEAKQAEITNLEQVIKGYKSSPKWKARKGELQGKLKKLQAELADLENA